MRNALGLGIAIALATAAPVGSIAAQDDMVAANYAVQYSAEELENLLAPVALYPDPILAQVLVAASYPDEVDLAARHIAVYGSTNIDGQPWDISVKALAHYAPVLNLMADRPDWTVALGQAYAAQPQEVMDAVQSLRGLARSHGNLATTAEQRVVVEDRYIRILPARPQVVYVPVYDPYVVYYQPVMHLGVYRNGWSFGAAFPIGVWLTYDFDWRHRHVYYHGWDTRAYRTGWFVHSRPFIVVNNIYVHRRPRIVVVNHTVINRGVHWDRMGRYNYLHRKVAWERDGRRGPRGYVAGAGPDRRGGRDDDDRGRNPSWDRTGRGVTGRVTEAGPAQRTAQPRRAVSTSGSTARSTARPQNSATRTTATRATTRSASTPSTATRSTSTRSQTAAAPRPTNGARQPSWNPRGTATARPVNTAARRSTTPTRNAPIATRQSAPRQTGGSVQRSAPQQSRPAASRPQVTRTQAGRPTATRATVSRPQATTRTQASRPTASRPQQSRPQAAPRTQSAPRARSAPQARTSGAASSRAASSSRGGSTARGSSSSRRPE